MEQNQTIRVLRALGAGSKDWAATMNRFYTKTHREAPGMSQGWLPRRSARRAQVLMMGIAGCCWYCLLFNGEYIVYIFVYIVYDDQYIVLLLIVILDDGNFLLILYNYKKSEFYQPVDENRPGLGRHSVWTSPLCGWCQLCFFRWCLATLATDSSMYCQ